MQKGCFNMTEEPAMICWQVSQQVFTLDNSVASPNYLVDTCMLTDTHTCQVRCTPVCYDLKETTNTHMTPILNGLYIKLWTSSHI